MRGTCKWSEEAVIDYILNENRDSAAYHTFETHLSFCKHCQLQFAYWEEILRGKEVFYIKRSNSKFQKPYLAAMLSYLKPGPPLKIKKKVDKTLFWENANRGIRSKTKIKWMVASIMVVLILMSSFSFATQPAGEKKAPAVSQTGENTILFDSIS